MTFSQLLYVQPFIVFVVLLAMSSTRGLAEPGRARQGNSLMPPQGGWTEKTVLSHLGSATLTSTDRLRLLTELKGVGTQTSLAFLASWRLDDEVARQYVREVISVIQYRSTPHEKQAAILEKMLADRESQAWDSFVNIAADDGVLHALPALMRLSGDVKSIRRGSQEERAYLAQVKLRYQSKYSKPLAYLLASKCSGEDDGPLHRHPCPIRLWGIRMLTRAPGPDVVRHLKISMEDLARKHRQSAQALVSNQIEWTPEIAATVVYYTATYEALKSMGVSVDRDPALTPSDCDRW